MRPRSSSWAMGWPDHTSLTSGTGAGRHAARYRRAAGGHRASLQPVNWRGDRSTLDVENAMTGSQTNASRIRALNATIRYAMWSVFGWRPARPGPARGGTAEVEALLEQVASLDVVVRGSYDVSALRADADMMVWWHAPSAAALQEAYGMLRRTALGRHLAPWVLDGDAPPGRVQQEPPARVPGRTSRPATTSACTRSCVPTSGTCCRTQERRGCWPSTADGPRVPDCGPTRRPCSRWRYSGYSRVRGPEMNYMRTQLKTNQPDSPRCLNG